VALLLTRLADERVREREREKPLQSHLPSSSLSPLSHQI
jgi:hypothetical protein